MEVTLNNQIRQSPKLSFLSAEKEKPELNKKKTPASPVELKETKDSVNVSARSNTEPKGLVSNVAYGWVNFTEGIKGVALGLTYGVITGGLFAVCNSIYNMHGKIKSGEKKFFDAVLHPIKTMSKTGKVLTFVIGGTVLAGNLVMAKLKANKRTADVDHMLYDGHRG